MGKINGCLKCLFVFFNVLFAIIGCLLIFGAVKASALGQMSSVGIPGIGWVWMFAISMFGISCLGIFAGCSEKDLALKIFAGFMVAGMIVMLSFGISLVVKRNTLRDAFTSATSEVSKTYMHDEDFRKMLSEIQSTVQCCGLTSVQDWGSEIPDSCACDDSSGGSGIFGSTGCRAKPQGTSGPNRIYDKPCGDYLFYFYDLVLKVSMAFLFGFAITALLGLLMSLLMLHQVKRHDSGGPAISMKSY